MLQIIQQPLWPAITKKVVQHTFRFTQSYFSPQKYCPTVLWMRTLLLCFELSRLCIRTWTSPCQFSQTHTPPLNNIYAALREKQRLNAVILVYDVCMCVLCVCVCVNTLNLGTTRNLSRDPTIQGDYKHCFECTCAFGATVKLGPSNHMTNLLMI